MGKGTGGLVSVESSLHDRVSRALGDLGLHPASPPALEAGHRLAARLIGPGITPLETLRTVQRHCGLAAFVRHEHDVLVGVFVFLLLNRRGLAAVLADDFDGLAPRLDHLAVPAEAPSAYYGWGFAATTPQARAAVVAGADVLRREVLTDLPFFCRAATAAGRRAVTLKLGYRDLPGSGSGVLWAPPAGGRRAA